MSNETAATQLNGVLERLRPLRSQKVSLPLALALVLIALLSTQLADWLWRSSAVLVFAAAVAIATALFGLVAGLMTAVASTFVVDFFYIPPIFTINWDVSLLLIAGEYVSLSAVAHFATKQVSSRIRRKAKLGVFGQLDGIVDGEAYGWAFDADNPSSPVNVLVCVNHRPVAETAAVYYRPDVADTMNCSGRHGFYVDLSGSVSSKEDSVIEVRISEPKLLTNCPATAQISMRGREACPAILFMHIPRTAGTAFRDAIVANYKQAEIAYLYPEPPGFLVEDLSVLPFQQRCGFRLVIGHFRYGVHSWLPQESTYATVARNPISRVFSQYLFLQHTRPAFMTERGRPLELEELLERNASVDFDNSLVRYFGGIDDNLVPPGTIDRAHYELAVHHLETRFSYVGHQECSQETYSALQRRFEWTAKPDIEPLNLATKAMELMQNDKLSKVVAHYNQWDCLFYQDVLRLFPLAR